MRRLLASPSPLLRRCFVCWLTTNDLLLRLAWGFSFRSSDRARFVTVKGSSSIVDDRDRGRSGADALVEWLVSRGSYVDPRVSVAPAEYGEDELGMFCRRDDDEDEDDEDRVLVWIPRSEFVTTADAESIADRDDVVAVAAEVADGDPERLLAAFVGSLRVGAVPDDVAVRRAAWRDSLPSPRALSHLPHNWPPRARRALLEGTSVGEVVERRLLAWTEEHAAIIERASASSSERRRRRRLDLPTWIWARSVVASRAFRDDTVTDRYAPVLVPLLDMLNHNAGPTNPEGRCAWDFDEEGLSLTRTPADDVARASVGSIATLTPLEISYGTHGNDGLLSEYGFAVDDGDHDASRDRVVVPVVVDASSFEVRVGIADEGSIRSLLSACRVAVRADEDEAEAMERAFDRERERLPFDPPSTPATLCRAPLSEANERATMTELRRVAEDRLGRYPTSTTEDEELLETTTTRDYSSWWEDPTDPRVRSAVIARRGEKRILIHLRALANTALNLLSRDDVDFDGAYRELETMLVRARSFGVVE